MGSLATAVAVVSPGSGQAEEGGMEMAPTSLPGCAQVLLTPSHRLELLLPPCCISTRLPWNGDLPSGRREKGSGGGWLCRGEQRACGSPSTALHSSNIAKNTILQYVIASFEEAVKGFASS